MAGAADAAGCLWLLNRCDLELVAVADADDYLVGEIYIAVPDGGAGAGAIAFVHRTEGATGAAPVPAIAITPAVTGRSIRIPESPDTGVCLDSLALAEVRGRCFHKPRRPSGLRRPARRSGRASRPVASGPSTV